MLDIQTAKLVEKIEENVIRGFIDRGDADQFIELINEVVSEQAKEFEAYKVAEAKATLGIK